MLQSSVVSVRVLLLGVLPVFLPIFFNRTESALSYVILATMGKMGFVFLVILLLTAKNA